MKKKYWYVFYHHYCPVCGKDRVVHKERVYEEPINRHVTQTYYDYCEGY